MGALSRTSCLRVFDLPARGGWPSIPSGTILSCVSHTTRSKGESMGRIRVEAIPTQVALRIRTDRADGHGNTDLQPIHVDEHPGYICRHCLEDPLIGESVYLVSYSPFDR